MAEFATNKLSPESELPQSSPSLLRALGRFTMSATTLLTAPDQSSYHRQMEQSMLGYQHPLHPCVEETVDNVREVTATLATVPPQEPTLSDKILRSANMIQFTDHFLAENEAFLLYDDTKALKDGFVAVSTDQSFPLSYDQQLAIALEIAEGDTTSALLNLCFSSRQYARWRDTISIRGLPDFGDDEILHEMKEWRNALLASKTTDPTQPQDPSGDTYYAWTHALAQSTFNGEPSIVNRAGNFIFTHGTSIMSVFVRYFTRRSVLSNHKEAANYGNAIGKAIYQQASGLERPSQGYRAPLEKL